jgi:hypothetical protein
VSAQVDLSRYLGLVRHYAKTSYVREMLLIECVARVLKNLIRKNMRELMKVHNYPLEEHFKAELMSIINLILGSYGYNIV